MLLLICNNATEFVLFTKMQFFVYCVHKFDDLSLKSVTTAIISVKHYNALLALAKASMCLK